MPTIILNAFAFSLNLYLAAEYHYWLNGVAAGVSLVLTFLSIEQDYKRKN